MSTEQLALLNKHNIKISKTQLELIKDLPLHNAETDFIVELATICNLLYRAGMPIVDDSHYDNVIIKELSLRNPDHPFLNQVEPEAFVGKTVPLPKPMLSTNKAYSEKTVRDWLSNVVTAAAIAQYPADQILIRVTSKLDGFACYDDGQLLYTRGDGLEGTDITFILDRGVKVVGTRIPGPGEIVVNKQYFQEHLSDTYENTRNFIGSVLREQQLSLIVQQACLAGAIVFQPFSLLPSWTGTIDELLHDFESIINNVWGLVDFDVDGVVLEVTQQDIQKLMGSTRHHHKWQLAFKRNEAPIEVPVLDVTYQTGKTGVITPVAELEPTMISGVTISRATAHNAGHVKKWSLGKGSIVKVVRAGLVIPKIIDAVKPGVMNIPATCPSCGSATGWENDKLYCSNLLTCPAQLECKLLYFFNTLGTADGFGPATIETLCRHGIRNIADIYELSIEQFRSMGFGLKQSDNLYAALNISRKVSVADWSFLAAFGITNIGRGGCELLLKHYPLSTIFDLTYAQIVAIKGFGDITAMTLVNTLKEIKPEFDRLYQLGFTIRYTPIGGEVTQDSPIKGKFVVFTGTMVTKTRQVMEQQAKSLGALVGSSVSGRTSYLVVGSDPGGTKLKAAKQHGTMVLSEQEYQQLIGQ